METCLSHSPFWALNEKNHGSSWIFRKILRLRTKALKFLSCQIGNGDSTFFWWDPWTSFGPLYNYLGADCPIRLGIPLFSTVSELRQGDGWSLHSARTVRQLQLLAYLSNLVFTSEIDTQWRS